MSYGAAEQSEARQRQSYEEIGRVKQGNGRAVRCSEMRRRGNVWLSKGKAAALFGNAAATERKDMRGLATAKLSQEQQWQSREKKGLAKAMQRNDLQRQS